MTASPLQAHFLIKHLHLESKTDIPRLSYFHFNPQIVPSFSHQHNFFFFGCWELDVRSIDPQQSSAFVRGQGLWWQEPFMVAVHMHWEKAGLSVSDGRTILDPAWISVNLHSSLTLHIDTARPNSSFLREMRVEKGSAGAVPYGGRTCAVCWNGERHETKQNCFPLKQTRKTTGFGNAWTFPTDFTQKYSKVWFGVTATCHWKITPQIIYKVSRSDLSSWSLPWKQNKSKQ